MKMICSFKYFPYHRIIVFVADKIFFKWGFYGHWCNYLGFLVYQLVTKAFKACGLPSFCWNEELAGNPITSFLFCHLFLLSSVIVTSLQFYWFTASCHFEWQTPWLSPNFLYAGFGICWRDGFIIWNLLESIKTDFTIWKITIIIQNTYFHRVAELVTLKIKTVLCKWCLILTPCILFAWSLHLWTLPALLPCRYHGPWGFNVTIAFSLNLISFTHTHTLWLACDGLESWYLWWA